MAQHGEGGLWPHPLVQLQPNRGFDVMLRLREPRRIFAKERVAITSRRPALAIGVTALRHEPARAPGGGERLVDVALAEMRVTQPADGPAQQICRAELLGQMDPFLDAP